MNLASKAVFRLVIFNEVISCLLSEVLLLNLGNMLQGSCSFYWFSVQECIYPPQVQLFYTFKTLLDFIRFHSYYTYIHTYNVLFSDPTYFLSRLRCPQITTLGQPPPKCCPDDHHLVELAWTLTLSRHPSLSCFTAGSSMAV